MEDLTKVRCFECVIIFAFDNEISKIWRENNKSFHCPNGHLNVFIPSVTDQLEILKKENKELKKKLTTISTELEVAKNELEIWKPNNEN